MNPPDPNDKTARDAKLKQHMRDTAIPIRPQPDEHQ